MVLPVLRQLLRPIHWFSFQSSILIDLEDSTAAKHISLQQCYHYTVKLCNTSSIRPQVQPTDFPVFGSARTRRHDPILQASATAFINNIQAQHPTDIFLWSDGAYSRSNTYSSTASLVTLRNRVLHTSGATINTTNSATAEICGILRNLTWLSHSDNSSASVHIMCDNQYAIKACCKHQKPHPCHITLLHAIHQTVASLPNITVHFHWIPGHTNNKFHCQIDRIATQSLH